MKTSSQYLSGLLVIAALVMGCTTDHQTLTLGSSNTGAWKFAVVGDTHVTDTNSAILSEMVTAMIQDGVSLVLMPGDLVEGGRRISSAGLHAELTLWQSLVLPLQQAGISIYPVRGNHEADAAENIAVWNTLFSGTNALPLNGPSGESNLSYAVTYHNALFIGLDNYVNLHRVNQAWLDQQLAANTLPHLFVFGHEPAFKAFHSDCLGEYPDDRNTFWQSLSSAGARTYFSGHDHFFDLSRIDDGDGNADNDLYQIIVGTGGSTHAMPRYAYNGSNAPYTPVGLFHDDSGYGYLLVEISGTGSRDLGVTMTWKQRIGNSGTYAPTSQGISYTATAR